MESSSSSESESDLHSLVYGIAALQEDRHWSHAMHYPRSKRKLEHKQTMSYPLLTGKGRPFYFRKVANFSDSFMCDNPFSESSTGEPSDSSQTPSSIATLLPGNTKLSVKHSMPLRKKSEVSFIKRKKESDDFRPCIDKWRFKHGLATTPKNTLLLQQKAGPSALSDCIKSPPDPKVVKLGRALASLKEPNLDKHLYTNHSKKLEPPQDKLDKFRTIMKHLPAEKGTPGTLKDPRSKIIDFPEYRGTERIKKNYYSKKESQDKLEKLIKAIAVALECKKKDIDYILKHLLAEKKTRRTSKHPRNETAYRDTERIEKIVKKLAEKESIDKLLIQKISNRRKDQMDNQVTNPSNGKSKKHAKGTQTTTAPHETLGEVFEDIEPHQLMRWKWLSKLPVSYIKKKLERNDEEENIGDIRGRLSEDTASSSDSIRSRKRKRIAFNQESVRNSLQYEMPTQKHKDSFRKFSIQNSSPKTLRDSSLKSILKKNGFSSEKKQMNRRMSGATTQGRIGTFPVDVEPSNLMSSHRKATEKFSPSDIQGKIIPEERAEELSEFSIEGQREIMDHVALENSNSSSQENFDELSVEHESMTYSNNSLFENQLRNGTRRMSEVPAETSQKFSVASIPSDETNESSTGKDQETPSDLPTPDSSTPPDYPKHSRHRTPSDSLTSDIPQDTFTYPPISEVDMFPSASFEYRTQMTSNIPEFPSTPLSPEHSVDPDYSTEQLLHKKFSLASSSPPYSSSPPELPDRPESFKWHRQADTDASSDEKSEENTTGKLKVKNNAFKKVTHALAFISHLSRLRNEKLPSMPLDEFSDSDLSRERFKEGTRKNAYKKDYPVEEDSSNEGFKRGNTNENKEQEESPVEGMKDIHESSTKRNSLVNKMKVLLTPSKLKASAKRAKDKVAFGKAKLQELNLKEKGRKILSDTKLKKGVKKIKKAVSSSKLKKGLGKVKSAAKVKKRLRKIKSAASSSKIKEGLGKVESAASSSKLKKGLGTIKSAAKFKKGLGKVKSAASSSKLKEGLGKVKSAASSSKLKKGLGTIKSAAKFKKGLGKVKSAASSSKLKEGLGKVKSAASSSKFKKGIGTIKSAAKFKKGLGKVKSAASSSKLKTGLGKIKKGTQATSKLKGFLGKFKKTASAGVSKLKTK